MSTEFEQNLAAMQPKLLREIELPQEPGMESVLRRNSRVGEPTWRYAIVGLAGFFLGVIATYFAMQPEIETQPTVAERIVVLPLDDQTIGTLRRPADLARIKPLTVSVQQVESPKILTPLSRFVIPAQAGT